MHVHLPKLHGWSAFAGKVHIMLTGVSIALSHNPASGMVTFYLR
jgi:hypothetical protein